MSHSPNLLEHLRFCHSHKNASDTVGSGMQATGPTFETNKAERTLIAQRTDELSHHAHNSVHHQMQLLQRHHQRVMSRKHRMFVPYRPKNESTKSASLLGQQTSQTTKIQGSAPNRDDTLSPTNFVRLTDYDKKHKDSKYRRWSPQMDTYLIQLLSNVAHSYPHDGSTELTKKDWLYISGNLRLANPETVYATYTKYSCQQHLFHVVHKRYLVWYELMVIAKNTEHQNEYSFRWSVNDGRFQVFTSKTNATITDETSIKELLFRDVLALPDFGSYNKGNLIVSDLFLTNTYSCMSLYHNEILPILVASDSKYQGGFADLYGNVPKFDYPEAQLPFDRPLRSVSVAKRMKSKEQDHKDRQVLRPHLVVHPSSILQTTSHLSDAANVCDGGEKRPPYSPDLVIHVSKQIRDISQVIHSTGESLRTPRRQYDTNQTPIHSVSAVSKLESAAISALESPAVVSKHNQCPFYIKDRKWFNRLLHLNSCGLLEAEEVLIVSEGVRDQKIPLFMLNILDNEYAINSDDADPNITEMQDEVVAEKIRKFVIPMVHRVQRTSLS